MQKFSFGDNWAVAIAKGLFIGILTAIPTPLPGLITGGGGLLGWAKQLQAARESKST